MDNKRALFIPNIEDEKIDFSFWLNNLPYRLCVGDIITVGLLNKKDKHIFNHISNPVIDRIQLMKDNKGYFQMCFYNVEYLNK